MGHLGHDRESYLLIIVKEYIKKKPKKLKPRKRNHAPIEPPSQEYYDNCYLEIYGDFIREQKEMNEIQTNEANEKKIINFVIRLFSEPNTYSALFRATKNILSSPSISYFTLLR